MEYGAFALEVRVHGRAVKEYRHGEEVWIEGRKGTEFVLRLENRSNRRVLAVPTIDGLSVMDGKEASFNSGGYVLGAYQHLDIPGWRLNDDKVASFRFRKPGDSYAAQRGTPQNIGVIGCAFFEEKAIDYSKIMRGGDPICARRRFSDQPRMPGLRVHGLVDTCEVERGFHWDSSSTKGMTPCCDIDQGQERGEVHAVGNVAPSLGTEFGSETQHRVVSITFNRPEKPAVEMAIRYGDRDELRQRGVDFDQRPVTANAPSAFPKEETGCKPPPGWSGK